MPITKRPWPITSGPLRVVALASSLAASIVGCSHVYVEPKPLKRYPPAQPSTSAARAAVTATPSAATASLGLDPWKGRRDLIRPPTLVAAEALHLPQLTRFTLRNGLSVLVLPDRHLPLINVRLLLRLGSIDEPADKVGLAEFSVTMLRHGVRALTADQISQRVDAVGASLGSSSGYEISSISCGGRTRVLNLCLDLVASLAVHPTFPSNEIKEVRDSLLGEVKEFRDDPGLLATLHFNNQLYGDDRPAGRPMTARSVRGITRAELIAFHRSHFVPAGAVLVISGDVAVDQLRSRVGDLYRSWRKRDLPRRSVKPVEDPVPGFRLLLVDKPDLSQSFFVLGHAGVSFRNPRRDAIRVMNFVLGGGGFNSRLMQRVRADGGKTYGIYSMFSTHSDDGAFVVRSFTRNDEIVATLTLVKQVLEAMHQSPPTASEIGAATGQIAGGYVLRFQTGSELAVELATAQLRGLGDAYVTELPLRVQRLQLADIAAAAADFIRPERLVGAIVGKAQVVAPLLRAAGLSYQQVSYLDPISARERKNASTKPPQGGGAS